MATLTVTATEHPETTPPSVRLDITASGTPTVTSATVFRTDVGGRTYPVRTSDGGALPVSGGVATLWDYEIPYGTTSVYSVAATGATTVTDTALLNVTSPWLVHPGVPSRSRPISVAEFGEVVRTADRGVFAVIGRSDPIAISGGARNAGAGVLEVWTDTDSERVALELLLSDSTPLLLNMPASLSWGVESCYVSIGDVTAARPVVYAGQPRRDWSLPYQIVSRPAGGSQSLRTWATVATEYATWADVAATGLTWAELSNPVT